MLTLTNLTLSLTKPNTLYIANKTLKLSTGTNTAITKSMSRSSGDGHINWDDVLVMPQSASINFQIATKHQFGYNPEELASVIQGKVKFDQSTIGTASQLITSPVFNMEGEKVGYLKVNVRRGGKNKNGHNSPLVSSQVMLPRQSKVSPSSQSLKSPNSPQKGQSLQITSFIAHVDTVKGKQIYLRLGWSKNTIITEMFTSKSGQIVYLGNYQIKSQLQQNGNDSQMSIELIDSNSSSVFGHCILPIDSLGKISKKGTLKDSQGRQLGDMFIDGKLVSKNEKSRVKALHEILGSSTLKQSSIMRNSMIKRRSVMNSNNTIRFTKEQRFFQNLEDKKNPNVCYQGVPSMDFKEQRTKKYYRGASIGRGHKQDFTQGGKGRPGVGEYFLPTIWDRY